MAYSNFYARFHNILSKIKESFQAIFNIKSSLFYLIFIVFWQLAAWFQAWFIQKNLSGDILVLHYNVDFGIDLVDDPIRIYLYPLLGLVIVLVNIILLACMYKNKNFKTLSHFLLGSAALFSIFLSIVLVSVYLINFL